MLIRDIGLTSNEDRELQPYQRYEGHTGCVEVSLNVHLYKVDTIPIGCIISIGCELEFRQ